MVIKSRVKRKDIKGHDDIIKVESKSLKELVDTANHVAFEVDLQHYDYKDYETDES